MREASKQNDMRKRLGGPAVALSCAMAALRAWCSGLCRRRGGYTPAQRPALLGIDALLPGGVDRGEIALGLLRLFTQLGQQVRVQIDGRLAEPLV